MSKRVGFFSKSGQKNEGELGEPAGDGKAPAIVLLQEYWGVNDHIRSLVNRLAAEGFLVFAPDLYHGTVVKKADEAALIEFGIRVRFRHDRPKTHAMPLPRPRRTRSIRPALGRPAFPRQSAPG